MSRSLLVAWMRLLALRPLPPRDAKVEQHLTFLTVYGLYPHTSLLACSVPHFHSKGLSRG